MPFCLPDPAYPVIKGISCHSVCDMGTAWWSPEWRKYGVTCRTPCRWARANSAHPVVGRAPGASSLVVVQGASPPVVVQTPHFCTRSPPPAVQTDQDPRQVTLTEPCCKSLSPSPLSFFSPCERLSRLNESELLLCQHVICTLEWYSPSWEQHFLEATYWHLLAHSGPAKRAHFWSDQITLVIDCHGPVPLCYFYICQHI